MYGLDCCIDWFCLLMYLAVIIAVLFMAFIAVINYNLCCFIYCMMDEYNNKERIIDSDG